MVPVDVYINSEAHNQKGTMHIEAVDVKRSAEVATKCHSDVEEKSLSGKALMGAWWNKMIDQEKRTKTKIINEKET